jgi:uncharacterized membrane protein
MTPARRSHFIDSMRGSAVVLMVVYHFCYDLDHFGVVAFDFNNDPFWLYLRTFIVCMFLTLVGISLMLAHHQGIRWKHALNRILVLLACSLLITIVSYWLFPGRTIWFGILHFISVASLLAILFVKHPVYSFIIGVLLITIGNTVSDSHFNQPWLHWIGLMTHKPLTEDYVPLLPWLGVVLCGITFGHLLIHSSAGKRLLDSSNPITMSAPLNLAGRYSLWIYMLHQPLLFGLLWLVTTFT